MSAQDVAQVIQLSAISDTLTKKVAEYNSKGVSALTGLCQEFEVDGTIIIKYCDDLSVDRNDAESIIGVFAGLILLQQSH